MEDEIIHWKKELNYSPPSYVPYKKQVHHYTCEECNYHWEVTEDEPDIDDDNMEDILVDDMFSFTAPDVCPLCGSGDITEK